MSYQLHVILGYLGETPELRHIPENQAVTTFSVAVNERRGEREVTTWYQVTAWGALAEIASVYLEKGRMVLIEGRHLRASAFVDQESRPRASLELRADRIQFLDSGGEAETTRHERKGGEISQE